MTPLVIAVCALGFAAAQAQPSSELPKWVLDLSRIRRHARGSFERLPDYACSETIKRSHKLPNRDWEDVDTLKFEVARVGDKELYGAAGSTFFEFDSLSEPVKSGFLGSGAFSTVAKNLFANDAARFTWLEEDRIFATPALHYAYEIPAFGGGFLLQSNGRSARIGLRGAFWVNARSLDVLRIQAEAVGIPVALRMLNSSTTVDYARVKIGRVQVLLPMSAVETITDLLGIQDRNETTFSGCREFTGNSLLHFEIPAAPEPQRRPAPSPKKK